MSCDLEGFKKEGVKIQKPHDVIYEKLFQRIRGSIEDILKSQVTQFAVAENHQAT